MVRMESFRDHNRGEKAGEIVVFKILYMITELKTQITVQILDG